MPASLMVPLRGSRENEELLYGRIAAVVLLAARLALSGCGSNSNVAGNINGTWNATLNSSGTETFAFVTNLTVNSDGSLVTSSINFTVNNTAITFPTVTETGSFTLSGNFNGQVSETFHYVVSSTETAVNTLILDGTVSGGQITGTWMVPGATVGCSGSGTFTMTPMLGR
jgi:hypothetical protein